MSEIMLWLNIEKVTILANVSKIPKDYFKTRDDMFIFAYKGGIYENNR